MLDAAGRVVGIDVGSDDGPFQPIGPPSTEAIPIDDALSTVAQIRAGTTTDTVHVGPSAFLGDLTKPFYRRMDPPGCTMDLYGAALQLRAAASSAPRTTA